VLEGTRLSSPKQIQSLGTTYLALRAQLFHRIEGHFPKLMRRMPPPAQRRNTAYLNRQNSRFGWLACDMDGQAPTRWTGLAICLGGSVEQRFLPGDVGAGYLDGPPASTAPL
jgi:hypothetical protein